MPLTAFAALGIAVVTFVAGATFAEASGVASVLLAALAAASALALFLIMQWHVLKSRIEKPLMQLERELAGDAPITSERDALWGSLRSRVEEARAATLRAEREATAERERSRGYHDRLECRLEADRFLAKVVEALRPATSPEEFAAVACLIASQVWPQGDALVLELRAEEPNLVPLAACRHGTPLRSEELAALVPAGRYTRAVLPIAVKRTLLTGESVSLGLPFSDDPCFPEARSFTGVGLEHRGGITALLYVVSPEAEPPSPAGLTQARPYLSLAYSRAAYADAVHEAEIRDGLTGVFTQSHFLQVLQYEIVRANRYGRVVSCACLDLDNVKRVNEKYGPHVGDLVIAETAGVILEQVRLSDVVARMSGGTFALIMPETVPDVASTVIERLCAHVAQHPYLIRRTDVERMTLSAGVAAHPPSGATALELFDAARDAMLAAKRREGNRVAGLQV